jgi:two-component system, cell cycle sensor histidine kinase and response regulator CckA
MSANNETDGSVGRNPQDAARLERLMRLSSDAFFVVTLTGGIRCAYVSPQIEALTGHAPLSYLTEPSLFRRLLEPEGLDAVTTAFEQIVQGESSSSVECAIRHGSGDVRWLRCSAVRITDHANRPVAVEGVLTDVTEQRHLREAITVSEQRFKVFIRTAPMPLCITSFDGCYVEVSDTFCDLSGHSREEVIGKNSVDLNIWADSADRDRMIKGLKEQGTVLGLEVSFRKKDSNITIVELFARVADYYGQPVIFSVTRDLTAQRQAEESRRQMERHVEQVQRLESLGVLAGGIAHDFNNMLAVISGNSALARQNLTASRAEVTLRCLGEIEHAAMQARHLTQQLRTFARGGAPEREIIALEPILREAANFALTGSRHRCVFELSNDVWNVDVDSGQLRQVVHNLVLNADQAMPRPSAIQIRASNVTDPAPSNAKWVKVSVSDSGPGVPPDIASKIFDPFFSTKDGGTGLGLATSHAIIAAHGGRLELDATAASVGCTFSFWIPAADGEALPAHPPTSQPRIQRKLHVLVLDDQAALVRVMKGALEDQGHRVQGVRDGHDAVEAYRGALERNDRFEVVIMDLTIPGGMGGVETLKLLKRLDPDVVAIAASGYSNDPVMSDHAAYGFAARLSKPFRLADFDDAIAAALGPRG